ncbi:MAG: sodium:solute symporter family transporter, partial [Planctomycetia bacterium]
MIYTFNPEAAAVFGLIVALTVGLSFYLGRQAQSASGFFAAGGGVHWFVNGVAFAGDYLSAASFLGISGMIAFYGYDGFLYCIGYLAGWAVALFVVAEPLKRLGKYTFADALDAKFQSRGIKLTAALSTLAASVFYLIPQMVGSGVLVKPLLGLPHWAGVVMVGAVVIAIVSSAGMVSTTYVQFLKGLLLIVFGFVLTVLILNRGFDVPNSHGTAPGRWSTAAELLKEPTNTELPPTDGWTGKPYVRVRGVFEGVEQTTVWRVEKRPAVEGKTPDDRLWRCQTVETKDGVKLVNGKPQGTKEGEHDFTRTGELIALADGSTCTGPLDPVGYLSTLQKATVLLWGSEEVADAGGTVKVYFPKPTAGAEVMQPGNHPAFKGLRSDKFVDKLNFLSLMLALFCGTASLPHILIRYYTVK